LYRRSNGKSRGKSRQARSGFVPALQLRFSDRVNAQDAQESDMPSEAIGSTAQSGNAQSGTVQSGMAQSGTGQSGPGQTETSHADTGQNDVHTLLDAQGQALDARAGQVRATAARLVDAQGRLLHQAGGSGRAMAGQTEGFIREQPVAVVLLAFAIGYVLARVGI
jgi:ElaB/YqjD/DUF883 family membrane-anchored ribosome-binding protein